MSVMRYFARNALIRLATFGVGAVAAFVVTPHLLAVLHKDGYGAWSLIASLAGYYLLLDCGLLKAVSTLFAKASAGNDQVAMDGIRDTAWALNAAGGLLVLLVGGGCALLAGLFVADRADLTAARLAVAIFSASMAVQLACRVFQALLMAELRWTTLACLSMGKTLFTSAAILLWTDSAAPPAANLVRVAVIIAGGNILEGTAQYLLARLYCRARIRRSAVSRARALELLRFGATVLIIQVGDALRANTQIYIVAGLLGLGQATLFSIARQCINYMSNAMLSAFGIMNPYFSRLRAGNGPGSEDDAGACRGPLLLSLCLSYTAGSTIALCLCFYGGLFITRWLGPAYAAAQVVLIPLALAGMLDFGQYPGSGFLFGLGRHRILAILSLAEGGLLILCGIPAAWLWGLPGLGWTVFGLTALTRLGILPRRLCRDAGLTPRTLYLATGGTLALQIGGQALYHWAILPLLRPDYLTLLLAAAGQCALAGLLSLICLRGMRRHVMEYAALTP